MYCLIVYGSITFANRVKKYFINDGDYVGIVHTPSEISKGGCSYSIKVKPQKLQEILEASNKFGFKIRGIYMQTEEGKFVPIDI